MKLSNFYVPVLLLVMLLSNDFQFSTLAGVLFLILLSMLVMKVRKLLRKLKKMGNNEKLCLPKMKARKILSDQKLLLVGLVVV